MTTPTVPTHPDGGAATPVHAVTGDSIGGAAIPVYVVSDGRPTLGPPPRRVKVITDADLTINGGNYWIEGRPAAMPVVSVTSGGDEGGVAIPVYVVSGSLSGGGGGGGGGLTMPQVASSTLQLDLRASQLALADNAPVPVWADASGLHRDFTATGNGITKQTDANGKPCVQGDGNDWMNGTNFADAPASMTIFTRFPSTAAVPTGIMFKLANAGCSDPGSTGWQVTYNGIKLYATSSDAISQAVAAFFSPGAHVVTREVISSSELHTYLDGILSDIYPGGGSVAGGGVAGGWSTSEPVRLFNDGAGLDCEFPQGGQTNSILIYSPAPNATDRAAIEAWLATDP